MFIIQDRLTEVRIIFTFLSSWRGASKHPPVKRSDDCVDPTSLISDEDQVTEYIMHVSVQH